MFSIDGTRLLLAATACAAAVLCGIVQFRSDGARVAHALTPTPTPTDTPSATPTPPTIFSVDAIPEGAIESTRSAAVGETFSVDVVLDWAERTIADEYEIVIDYGDVVLDGVGQAQNLYPFPPPVCNPPSFPPCRSNCSTVGPTAEDDTGTASSEIRCDFTAARDFIVIQSGPLARFTFRCEVAGTSEITIRGISDTFVQGIFGQKFNDEQHGATITCDASLTPVPTYTPTPPVAPTPGPPNAILSVDAVPGGATDASRTVHIGQNFSVDVVLDAYSGRPWIAYQARIVYDDPILDPLLPAAWENPPTLNVAGGNLFPFGSGPFCAPEDGTQSANGTDDDVGTARITMACLHNDTQQSTLAIGPLVQLAFRCERAGTTTLTLSGVGDTFMLDDTFHSHNDGQFNATITCDPQGAPSIEKVPLGHINNVDTSGTPPLANLFLCEDTDGDGPICSGPNEGELTFVERAFATDVLGAFEFQIKFDHKIFDIDLECVTAQDPGPACTGDADEDNILNTDADTWDVQLSQQLKADIGRAWGMDQCFRNVTENYINFACVSVGPEGAGLSGSIDLAEVTLHPDPDLKFRLTPGNDNGVVRVLLDENCELVDTLGHPLPGSIAGGLTPTCGDLAVTVRILEGDLDLDCDVDLADAQAIAQRYGMVIGLFLYDPWYDLEPNIKDFDVDAKDLQKVFGRIDSTCQHPIPPQPPVAPPQS